MVSLQEYAKRNNLKITTTGGNSNIKSPGQKAKAPVSSRSSSSSKSKRKSYVDTKGVIRYEGTTGYTESGYANAVGGGKTGQSGLPKQVAVVVKKEDKPVDQRQRVSIMPVKIQPVQAERNAEELNKYENPSWYQNVDNFFGGLLPGGITPGQDKAGDLLRKGKEQSLINNNQGELDRLKIIALEQELKDNLTRSQLKAEASGRQEEIDIYQDLVSKSGLENWGLFRSAEEKALQSTVQRDIFFQEQGNALGNLAQSFSQLQTIVGSNQSAIQSGLNADITSLAPIQPTSGILDSLTGKAGNTALLVGGGLLVGFLLFGRK